VRVTAGPPLFALDPSKLRRTSPTRKARRRRT
jgi:hypothetical protein